MVKRNCEYEQKHCQRTTPQKMEKDEKGIKPKSQQSFSTSKHEGMQELRVCQSACEYVGEENLLASVS